MSEPFNLDAAVAETAGEPFAFTWGGQHFTLEPLLAMDIERQLELIDKIENLDQASLEPADLLNIIKAIVGEATLTQLRAARPVGGAALMALLKQWMAHQGMSLGKSSGSPDSSDSTAPQSRQTSRSGRGRKTS